MGYRRRREEDERIDEAEQQRIMRIIEQEESSSDDDSSDDDSADEVASHGLDVKDCNESDSLCSDGDILNRSLESAEACEKACDPENYLRYVSVQAS